jgi:Zinc finger, C3HC4 type (RING finger)
MDVDLVICPYCRNLLQEPKTLPCMDTFCLKCLEEIENSGEWTSGSFCPECRQQFVIPSTGLQSFPSCTFLMKKIHLRRIENKDGTEKLCEFCVKALDKASVIPEASAYCVTCQQKFCDHCLQYHRIIPATMNHTVVSLGVDDVEQMLQSPDASILRCSNHVDRLAQLHCSSCCQLLCNDCLALHTWHELETMADAVQRFRDGLDACNSQMEEHLTSCSNWQQRIESSLSDLNEIETEITEKAEDLKRQIDEHKQELLDRIRSLRSENEASRRKHMPMMRSLYKTAAFAKDLSRMGSNEDLMLFSKPAINSANKHLLSDAANLPTVNNFKFVSSRNAREKKINVVGSVG